MTKVKINNLTLFTNDILERSHAYFNDIKASMSSHLKDTQDNQFTQFEQKSHQIDAQIIKLRSKMFQ